MKLKNRPKFYYTLKKYFVASHIHNSEEIHGHNFLCIAKFELKDTEKIKNVFFQTIKKLDYKILNELEFFKSHTPSTENIALFVYNNLKANANVLKVEVFETVNFSGGIKKC